MRKHPVIILLLSGLWTSAAGGAPIRILPLGDSITHGYYTGGSNFSGYRKELKNLLDSGGYSTDFVGSLTNGAFADNQHEGHDGWHADDASTTNDILGHVSGWVTASDADVVLLHIGTNDSLADGEDATEVSDILDQVFGANGNATVVLALIIKADPAVYAWSGDVSIYNSNLNTMAQTRITNGDDIIVVDMENGAGIDYSSSDMIGIHPSPIGYDKMATNWYPAATEAIARQLAHRAPLIEAISTSGNMVFLELGNLSPGTTVNIEESLSLTSTNWFIADSTTPTSTVAIWTNSVATTNQTAFYRLTLP